ncbi:hypothetical protein ACFQ5J_11830 [Lacticaseibacillus baoqingensis]|uniref:Uncharacterized protein n=1 Tax=Lacticaseibacillus baoqingensis TaxID=2486013 RepID=A0ABW4E7N9_9LACO|nr:hypothetical protein [Lacticaseibacillus baoqingensis]
MNSKLIACLVVAGTLGLTTPTTTAAATNDPPIVNPEDPAQQVLPVDNDDAAPTQSSPPAKDVPAKAAPAKPTPAKPKAKPKPKAAPRHKHKRHRYVDEQFFHEEVIMTQARNIPGGNPDPDYRERLAKTTARLSGLVLCGRPQGLRQPA